MSFVAVIPQCDVHTPAEVIEAIGKGMQSRLVGIAMSHGAVEEYRNQVDKLHIHFSASLTVCNAMRWDIAPYLRQVMAKSRNFWSSGFRDDNINEDLKKEMEDSIDELLTKLNDIHRIRTYSWVDASFAEHGCDSLHDYLLVDGEELVLAKRGEEEKTVQIKVYQRNSETIEFGGEFHGFKHGVVESVAYYEEDDTKHFLRFEEDTLFFRTEAPKGEHISSKHGKFM